MDTQVLHRFQTLRRVAAAALTALALAFIAGCSGPQDTPDTSKSGPRTDKSANDPGTADGPVTEDVAALWSNTAGEYVEGTTIDINCPAGGTLAASIWGGDNGIYTDDSAICVAAVHAGLITVDEGGTVVIEKNPGEDDYGGGFTANGVTSLPWPDPWTGSFVFPES